MRVGDGMSVLAARPAVDLVLGFGGVVTRQGVVHGAYGFIKANTLAPVLPLALSATEQTALQNSPHQPVLQKGLALVHAGQVIIRSNP